jgi:hypothetical protein
MGNTCKHGNYKKLLDFTIKIVKITRSIGNFTLENFQVQIKGISQPVSSLVTLDTYSQEELIAIVLLLGIGLYLSRSFFQGIIIKIQKRIVNYMEGNLFPHTPILKVYYDRGFFTLYWTILWLICRFTFIKPVYLLLVELTDWSIGAQFFSIALSMLIALIPSLLLTVVEDLNEIISALHFYVCSTYRMYLRIILRIYVLHIYTMNNNIRAFLRFMFLFSLFAGYLFTNSSVILSLWLTIIYLGVYCEYIVSKIIDRNQVMENVETPIYTIDPDMFLYNFRFPYWKNKLPYFYDEDAYERGYYFRAMDPKIFDKHVEWHNNFMNTLKKALKDMEDPRYVYAQLSMGLKSADTMNIKQEESIKQALKNLEKRIFKEYPDSRPVIEVLKREILAKYPHWRKDFTKNVKLKNISKKNNISNRGMRSYHTTPRLFMPGSEDTGIDPTFPVFKNPIDMGPFDQKLEEMGVRPEDGITVQHEMTPEGLKFKNQYGHPQAEEYSHMMPSLDPEKVYPDQHAEFVIGKDGVVRPYSETSAEAFQNKDSSAALGGAAQKAAPKVSTGELTKKLSSNASGAAVKGLGKMKNPAAFAAAVVGLVAFVGSVEQTYELVQQPGSFTNDTIEGSQKAVTNAIKKGPDLAESMARNYANNDTMMDLQNTRNRPQPGAKGLFSGLKSFLGRGN